MKDRVMVGDIQSVVCQGRHNAILKMRTAKSLESHFPTHQENNNIISLV